MEGFLSLFSNTLGSLGSGKIGHALIGLLILVVGLIVVKFLTGIFRRVLNRVDFLDRSNLSNPIASLINALLTIFGIYSPP